MQLVLIIANWDKQAKQTCHANNRTEMNKDLWSWCRSAKRLGVEKDTRLITLIVAYFHGNSPPSRSGNLALLANDTERVIILAPGCGPPI